MEIVSCLQWAIISQWISSHRFFMPLPTICDYHQTRSPLEKGAAKGRDRRKRQLSDFFVADMGDCSKYRIQQMAVIRDDDFLTSAFISLWGSCTSSRHSILSLWRGPSPRAYSLGIISHGLSFRCGELCLFEALYPAPLARPFSKGLLAGDYLTWVFIPLRRIVPLQGTPSCAFGAALLQGPTRGGLSHIGFHAAATNCASSRHSILCLWRGPFPRAYARK